MTNRRTLAAAVLPVFMIAAAAIMPARLAAQPPSSAGLTTSIVQTIPGLGTFAGTLTTTSVQAAGGVLNAVGTLTGTFTPLVGPALPVNQAVTVPITNLTGTCTILTLHVGAIHLNLLGLDVNLAPIDLVITANAGPGNLLGNLLCSVANLLNNGGLLSQIAALLNQILGAIRV